MSAISVRPSVIVLNGDLLLVVHSSYNGQKYYLLPGGGIEGNETIVSCAKREVKEETNLDVDIVKVAYLNDYITANGRCLNVYLLGKLMSDATVTHLKDPDLKKGAIKKAEWVSLKKLAELDFRPKELIMRIMKDKDEFSSEDNYFTG